MSDQPHWPAFEPGAQVTIVKISPEGEAVTTYPGWVIDAGASASWIALRADWVRRVVEMDGLQFIPGDTLHEFFSLTDWFNCFSVWSPEGHLRGWYANVTHPTRLDASTDPLTVSWPDLYVDLIGLPSGDYTVRDEDELEESGLLEQDPALHARILATRDHIIARFLAREFPFHESTR